MLAALYPQEDSWYSFLLEIECPQGRSVAGNIGSIENFSDLIGNRTRDLRACSIVISHLISVVFYLFLFMVNLRSRNSVVGIVTGYGLDDLEVGVRVLVGSRIFTSPCRPDRLWGPPNLLYNGCQGLFLGGKAAGP
jgi:hypothetical protein